MEQLPQVIRLGQVSSANTSLADLWSAAPAPAPFTVVVADSQTAGRGRMGRTWTAPRATSMLASILVPVAQRVAPWLPLLAGVAVRQLAGFLLPSRSIELKWPNDVRVVAASGPKKLSGILCQYLGSREGDVSGVEWVAVGIGINLSQTASELPGDGAASVALEGGPSVDPALLALGCATSLRDLLDEDHSSLRELAEANCSTIGRISRGEGTDAISG